MTLPSLQSYNFQVLAGVSPSNFVRYVENPANQASVNVETPVSVPANTNYQAVNLATLFPALSNGQVLVVQEITQPGTGFDISADNSNVGFPVRANSIFAVGINGLPTFYVSNPSSTAIQLLVTVLGS